jgi:hypothetical protein
MFRKIIPLLAIAVAIIGVSACKHNKQAGTADSPKPASPNPAPDTGETSSTPTKPKAEKPTPTPKIDEALVKTLSNIQAARLSPNWLTAKANLSYADSYMSKSATAYIRLKKDEALWISVRKLGLEAARVLITRDSFHLLNRLQRTYTTGKFSALMAQYQLPLDFDGLQDLVLGNAIFLNKETPNSVSFDGKEYALNAKSDKLSADYRVDGSVFVVKNMLFQDAHNGRTIDLGFKEHKKMADKHIFSYIRSVNLNSQQTGNVAIGLDFSEVAFNEPKDIKFEVPPSYKKNN